MAYSKKRKGNSKRNYTRRRGNNRRRNNNSNLSKKRRPRKVRSKRSKRRSYNTHLNLTNMKGGGEQEEQLIKINIMDPIYEPPKGKKVDGKKYKTILNLQINENSINYIGLADGNVYTLPLLICLNDNHVYYPYFKNEHSSFVLEMKRVFDYELIEGITDYPVEFNDIVPYIQNYVLFRRIFPQNDIDIDFLSSFRPQDSTILQTDRDVQSKFDKNRFHFRLNYIDSPHPDNMRKISITDLDNATNALSYDIKIDIEVLKLKYKNIVLRFDLKQHFLISQSPTDESEYYFSFYDTHTIRTIIQRKESQDPGYYTRLAGLVG